LRSSFYSVLLSLWASVPKVHNRLYSGMMLSNVLIILFEELNGPTPTPQFATVLILNLPWLLMPMFIIYRSLRAPQLFLEV